MNPVLVVRLAVLSLFGTGFAVAAQNEQAPTVVFICEHGSVKSIIAAAHFNRMAKAKGLPYRAVSRGIHPDAEIPAIVKAGLVADGFDVSAFRPQSIDVGEIQRARQVVTLACELPKSTPPRATKAINWQDIPTLSNGYEVMRQAIVTRVDALIQMMSDPSRRTRPKKRGLSD